MIKNISFDPRFLKEFSIIPFEETRKIQYESYCRADYYQLIWIKEGSAIFEVDMKSVPLNTNNYVCIGKNMVYKFDSTSQYSGYIMSFTDFYFCRGEQDILFLQSARIFNDLVTPISSESIEPYSDSLNVERMLSIYNDEKDPLRDDMLHTLLKLFLYRFEASFSGTSSVVVPDTNHTYVRDFKRLVDENFINHKELSFYTDQLGISFKQLLYATKQVLGKNAKEVIIEKTIIEAKRFLMYSGFSIKQIAFCLGFNEPNNFSIFFHKYTGMTPGTFKKNFMDPSIK